ncbi:Zn-dependent hydrolase [Paenibacillus montanisoli]|uniref:Allantoate amidohydrolase n=1 Tax=Paenibacillus montanisoli TaxID=2081970 RepID=A0A328UCL4_9BACL|nr:Zn-dependent hydrolase [Paenibacillus montanisoli]RAP77776.1 allantoate amidohydrolase [Paenibacillus montanisoli]
MEAHGERLHAADILSQLAAIGLEPDGGITRLLYDPAWRQAQQAVARIMGEAGLSVSTDAIGNVYGKLEGTDRDAPSFVTGSHIDSVRFGGQYDGALGIAAGIAALSKLKQSFGQPRRTLEVVSFCEEEGSRFPLAYWGSGNVTGCKPFAGSLEAADAQGVSLREAMAGAGYDPSAHRDCRRTDIEAFVELHIEQGAVLEREQREIGIVNAIFGQRRYFVDVEGRSDHAGTTPMQMREDALAAAAEMIVRLRKAALETGDGLVATVGMLEVSPGIANVIPGNVRFSLDIRHREETAIEDFCDRTFLSFSAIAAQHRVTARYTCWLSELPSPPMDAELRERLARICDASGYAHLEISSGAGHDAGLFARICKAAMIFVPSRGGISHSPLEYTAPEEIERGCDVLTQLLYQLAYGEEGL